MSTGLSRDSLIKSTIHILIGKTMKYMSMPSIVAKAITCLLLSTAGTTLSHAQTNDSIAHTMLVADYDYTCQTSNAKGEELKVSYGLTLQVAQDMACTMGRKRHSGENDMSERLLYAPVTWQNYPQGKMTSIETIPPYQYLTSEAMPQLKWKVQAEHDTICGLPCQKAIGQYGGRTWTAWFAEGLPSRFGPWRLGGLPGLILRAVSEDGIHHFECNRVDFVKEAIAYSVPNEAVKCTRAKFVKLRNSTFGNPNYLTNPTYYIKPEQIGSMTVMAGSVLIGTVPINMKPAKYQPLDL